MNNITQLIYIFLLSAYCIGCSSESTTTDKKVDEDGLLSKLSTELVSNPKSQADKERNLLINYAIDKGLDINGTTSGCYYTVVQPGTGAHPALDDKLQAHYEGRLLDGTVFDSSYKRGKPLEFSLQQMIKGWQVVIPLLKPGSKAELLIPSHLAYGTRGFPGLIPPDSPLHFTVELIAIQQ